MNFRKLSIMLCVPLFMSVNAFGKDLVLQKTDFLHAKQTVSNKNFSNVYAKLSESGKKKLKGVSNPIGRKITIEVAGLGHTLRLKAAVNEKIQFGPFEVGDAKRIVNQINQQ